MATAQCPTCYSPATLRCAGCKEVHYCSKICQKANWRSHKNLCKTLSDFLTRPADNMRRVIVFPADGDKPKFMWLPVVDFLGTQRSVDKKQVMGTCFSVPETISNHVVTRKPLKHEMLFYYDDNFLKNFNSKNAAIKTATAGKVPFDWQGPLLAFCGDVSPEPDNDDMVAIQDMDMEMYADLVAWLLWFDPVNGRGRRTTTVQFFMQVKCVTAVCEGEIRDNGSAAYKVQERSTWGYPFSGGADVSAISKRIGMPLMAMKLPTDPRRGKDSHNQASYFFLGIDPSPKLQLSDTQAVWGMRPGKWHENVGNMLIARVDRAPLEIEIVDALGDFCEHHLDAYLARGSGRDDADETESRGGALDKKQKALDEITPKRWAEYLQQWRKNKAGAGPTSSFDVEETIDGAARVALSYGDSELLLVQLDSKY